MNPQDLINVPFGFNANYYYNKQTHKLYLRAPIVNSYGEYSYQEIKLKSHNNYYVHSYDQIQHRISHKTLLRLIDPSYNFNNYIPVKSAFKPFKYSAVLSYLKRHNIALPRRYRVINPLGRYVYAFKQDDLNRLKEIKKSYTDTQYNPNNFVTLQNLPRFHNYHYDPATDCVYNLTGRKLKQCRNGTYALTIDNKRKYISVNKIKKALKI